MPPKAASNPKKGALQSSGRVARASARGLAAVNADNDAATDRRSVILHAATRLFAEYGFEATTVRQIANEVNILSGSLYHHFATKEDLLHEIVRDGLTRLVEENVRVSHLTLDAESKLVTLLVFRLTQLTENPEVHATLSNEAQFFRRRDDFSYVQDAKADGYKTLESILRDGIKTGLFKPDLDIYLTIGTISRMLGSTARWFRSDIIYSVRAPYSYSLEAIIEYHLNFILAAIREPSRISAPIPRP